MKDKIEKMTRLVTIEGGFIQKEYKLELYKGDKIEFKHGRCELGGIHIYIDGDFYDCFETTHHWEKNKITGLNEPTSNFKGVKNCN